MSAKQLTLTARDTELLTHAFQCLKERPNIDYGLMACNAGFKGAKSARDSWSRLYDKIISGDTAGGEPATPASPKKKGTPGKRKAASADDNDDDDVEASPLKKKKNATPSKVTGKKKSAATIDQEDGEDPVAAAVESKVDKEDDE